MTKEEILDIFEYVSTVDSAHASNLTYAVTLLHNCITKSLEVVKDQILDATINNKFDELPQLSKYCKGIQEIEKQIIDCNLAINALKDRNVIAEIPGQTADKEIIDYSQYTVDNTVKHTLDENFVFSKIMKFSFLGNDYSVDSWKDTLMKVSEILYEKDPRKFRSFVGDPAMNGEKCAYFSYKPSYASDGELRSKKMKISDIYVYTNFNANTIVKFICKMLKQYDISEKDMAVYLRADYKDLHK